ncbi:protein of unknown function [Blastococcus saxobsidens DD2]|uniref:Uncharacterized protein n=1 Tax=Blastococcus saxobsidens (strain DD2) TaxID=1146883 RepID=H6RRP0_BLASD|nr:protein of unknown function [Blastococcus saxobsidens DD2]
MALLPAADDDVELLAAELAELDELSLAGVDDVPPSEEELPAVSEAELLFRLSVR